MRKLVIRKGLLALALLVLSLACTLTTVPNTATSEPPANVTATQEALPSPPRWVLYERALSTVLLGPVGETQPDVSRDHGLCEWEIWGQKGNEVYVWAECQVAYSATGMATSAPVVIRLAEDGSITEVIMANEGWGNIRDLFPEDVLARIFNNEFDAVKAMQHIALRRADPSIPPAIIEQGVELP